MSDRPRQLVSGGDVLALTAKGQNELGGSATSLGAQELEVLVLIDGKSTLDQTAARLPQIGNERIADIAGRLLRDELIELVKDKAGALEFVDFFQTTQDLEPSAAAMVAAKREAATTTSLLQQQGYFVRIARRPGSAKKSGDARVMRVLVVEDEPYLAKLLKAVLKSESFDVQTAKNREEIVVELRRPPRPDLVLLDVVLPDIDGFEVLLKIRQHQVLKAVPVVMLTAKATRDAVIRGLAGGADGYITKPFEIDVLVKAVKVVLGLSDGVEKASANPDPWSG